MAIKRERETKNKIDIKGILIAVGENVIEVRDEKSGQSELFNFDELGIFLGKSFKFSISESSKEEFEPEDAENEETEDDD